jgi:glycosyltransferase involved in cell wall biosynthesis
MAAAPKVTIGIPVYNAERYLGETLNALLGQEYGDFEIVISDNHSTDGTLALCEAHARSDSRIRLFRSEKNFGAVHNYNRVFREARGEYFKWAAADDLCRPSLLSKCVRVLDERADVVLAYPQTEIIDGNGAHLQYYNDMLHLHEDCPVERFRTAMQRMGLCNAVCGLIRTSVLAKTQLIGKYIGADAMLLLELSLHGKFHEIPEPLFCRRMHADSYSAESSTQGMETFLAAGAKGAWNHVAWSMMSDYMRVFVAAPLSPRQKLRLAKVILHAAVAMRIELSRELFELPQRLLGRERSIS